MMLNRPGHTQVIRAPAHGVQAAGLREGQVLQGMIRGAPSGLSLHLAGLKVPLEGELPFQPGQTVTVHVLSTEGGLRLHLTTQEPEATTASEQLTDLPRMLVNLLRDFPDLQQLQNPISLLPANLPPTQEAIRQLMLLFSTRQSLGEDLQQLVDLLQQAVEAGVVDAASVANLRAFLGPTEAASPDVLETLVARLASGTGTRIESRLAAALASGHVTDLIRELRSTLRWEVTQLRGRDALYRYMRGIGQLRNFERALDNVLDRLAGNQIQHLRTLEQPYAFLELPMPPDSGIHRAQIHYFREGEGHAGQERNPTGTLVFDLRMSQLGDLWINLRTAPGQCLCDFRVSNLEGAEAIREARQELEAALMDAGYGETQVTVEVWEGTRDEELIRLVQRFAGFSKRI